MTIEAQLERIADALEALNGTRTVAPSDKKDEALQQEATKVKAKKPAKPAADVADVADEAPTLDDVRDALKALQIVTDAATAKDLLAEHGAKLDDSKYDALIVAAEAAAAEASDDD